MATLIGVVSTVTLREKPEGSSRPSKAGLTGPRGLTVDSKGNLIVADTGNQRIRQITPEGEISTLANVEGKEPLSVAVDPHNGVLFSANGAIWRINSAGEVSLVVGGECLFGESLGIVLDETGSILIVTDFNNHRVKQVNLKTGEVTTVVGALGYSGHTDGTEWASLSNPCHAAMINPSDVFIVQNHSIRRIKEGVLSTFAGGSLGYEDGPGNLAHFSFPKNIVRDPRTGNMFLADEQNSRIRCITPEGVVFTIAGQSAVGRADGRGAEASFWAPYGITLAPDGALYVCDVTTDNVRKIVLEALAQPESKSSELTRDAAPVESKEDKQEEGEGEEEGEDEPDPLPTRGKNAKGRGKKSAKEGEPEEKTKKKAKKREAPPPPPTTRSTRSKAR